MGSSFPPRCDFTHEISRVFVALNKFSKTNMADPEKATKVENGIEDEDVEDEEVSTNAKAAMVAELLKNPALFSMLNRDYISSLPAPVKRRLKALKKFNLNRQKLRPNSTKKFINWNANIMNCINRFTKNAPQLPRVNMNQMMMNVNGQATTKMMKILPAT